MGSRTGSPPRREEGVAPQQPPRSGSQDDRQSQHPDATNNESSCVQEAGSYRRWAGLLASGGVAARKSGYCEHEHKLSPALATEKYPRQADMNDLQVRRLVTILLILAGHAARAPFTVLPDRAPDVDHGQDPRSMLTVCRSRFTVFPSVPQKSESRAILSDFARC